MKCMGMSALATMILLAAMVVQDQPGTTIENRRVEFANLVIGRVHRESGGTGTCFPVKRIREDTPGKIEPKIRDRLILVTARHVVHGIDYVEDPKTKVKTSKDVFNVQKIELYQQEKLVFETTEVKVLSTDEELDVAILEIRIDQKVDIPILILSKKPPTAGAPCFAFGCQAGMVPTFTYGYVCRPSRDDYDKKGSWITSANVFPGASGGPVFDKYTGEVIGITSALAKAPFENPWGPPILVPITHVHLFIDASKIREWLKL